jgi:hypothetical protein
MIAFQQVESAWFGGDGVDGVLGIIVQGQIVFIIVGGKGAYLKAGVGNVHCALHQEHGLSGRLAAFEYQPRRGEMQHMNALADFRQVRIAEAVKGNEVLQPLEINAGRVIAHTE